MKSDDFTAYKLSALTFLIIVGLCGFWALNGLRSGASSEWRTAGYSLLALSATTGIWSGLLSGMGRPSIVMFLVGFFAQAVCALGVVILTLGGGFTEWSFGFWAVTAAGWAPAYAWFFCISWLLHAIYSQEFDIED